MLVLSAATAGAPTSAGRAALPQNRVPSATFTASWGDIGTFAAGNVADGRVHTCGVSLTSQEPTAPYTRRKERS